MSDPGAEPAIEPTAPHHPSQLRSPRRGMCAAVLAVEAVLMLMVAPVMITLAGVSVARGIAVSVAVALALLLLAGSLRKEWAYWGGWLMQAVLIGLGYFVPSMYVVGAIFAALWATAYLLGLKIERERAAAYSAHEAQPHTG